MIRFLVVLISLLALPLSSAAWYDPTSVTNNKYGIHIIDPNDLFDASNLVNSNGGDWGYVTIVIQEDNRDRDKWQNAFNEMRRRHVIPLVRLATHIDQGAWVIPSDESAKDWAKFLDSLNWPTQNRYIILFNEPNHANEWGNTINPGQYAQKAKLFADALHQASEDFFVMHAGLDVSANNGAGTMDALTYLRGMVREVPRVFDAADGLSSHSYPNPAFSGSPWAVGRGTLRSYQWEKEMLRSFGFSKNYPVFITETGWVHREGVTNLPFLLSSEAVGENLQIAAQNIWQDGSIVAVTPFVLNYQGYPFDHFSWKKLGTNEYYHQYFIYHAIPKLRGQPLQREQFALVDSLIPDTLISGSTYRLKATLKNTGQSILDTKNNYALEFTSSENFPVIFDPMDIIEPGQTKEISIHIDIPDGAKTSPYAVHLVHGTARHTLQTGTLAISIPPRGTIYAQLGWKKTHDARDVTILIYDESQLIHKITGRELKNGQIEIKELHNIIPGKSYRIVTLIPYYLPRQTIMILNSDVTNIPMKRFIPLDFDKDGKASLLDLLAMIRLPPKFIFSLFF